MNAVNKSLANKQEPRFLHSEDFVLKAKIYTINVMLANPKVKEAYLGG